MTRSDYELRLERAEYHVHELKTEVAGWLETHPYFVTVDLEEHSGEKVVGIELLEPPPARLSLIAGECLYNLRAALDHLVYGLALLHRGSLPEEIEEDLAFPIFSERDEFLAERAAKIVGTPPAAQTVIEGLQPYHGGDAFFFDPLWMLRALARADRHRLLHLVVLPTDGLFSVSAELVPQGEWESRANLIFGPIEGSAELARYPAVSNFEPNVGVDLKDALDVGFRNGLPGGGLRPASEILGLILGHVNGAVVPPLRPFLGKTH